MKKSLTPKETKEIIDGKILEDAKDIEKQRYADELNQE